MLWCGFVIRFLKFRVSYVRFAVLTPVFGLQQL